MNLHEYLNLLTEQIRCKKVRGEIAEEIEQHIEDQTEIFCMEGMENEKAMERAIREMGDPVEVGTALDRVHRPQMDWKLVGLILLLSVVKLVFTGTFFLPGTSSFAEQLFTIVMGTAIGGCMRWFGAFP